MFEVVLIDGVTHTFSPDRNDKGLEMWGIESPTGWVHVMQDDVVHYFPTARVASIRASVRPVDEEVSAD